MTVTVRAVLSSEGSETNFPDTPSTVGGFVCKRSSDGPDDSWRRVTAYSRGEVVATMTLVPIARIASGPRVLCIAYLDGDASLWQSWGVAQERYNPITAIRGFISGGNPTAVALRACRHMGWNICMERYAHCARREHR
jgi:hypothetical protein